MNMENVKAPLHTLNGQVLTKTSEQVTNFFIN